jgi:hypothetical protein
VSEMVGRNLPQTAMWKGFLGVFVGSILDDTTQRNVQEQETKTNI